MNSNSRFRHKLPLCRMGYANHSNMLLVQGLLKGFGTGVFSGVCCLDLQKHPWNQHDHNRPKTYNGNHAQKLMFLLLLTAIDEHLLLGFQLKSGPGPLFGFRVPPTFCTA
eukprot:2306438-Amphidinium_carterae.2